jgi:uracil-DNA glycosylase
MENPLPHLEPGWQAALNAAYAAPEMAVLREFLAEERTAGKIIFPPALQIFAAFNATPFSRVRVVILGQDPYHGQGQAHGLSFSVPQGVPPPPSIRNILKELHTDLGIASTSGNGCLDAWAAQGVLLLNTVLSVESGKPGSHQGRGWESFTDAAIRALAAQSRPIAFLLWGKDAHKKARLLHTPPHYVLQAAHPSPLSAHRGFFGSKPFSKVNAWLRAQGQGEIDWRI